MRRLLSVALCAILLMGVLPSISPPAEAIISAGVAVNTYSAYVGDAFTWTIYGLTSAIGPYTCNWNVYLDGVSYSNTINHSLHHNYSADTPGAYSARVLITDATPDYFVAYGPAVIVSFRPAPKITKVEATGGTSLKVTWTKVAGASGYYLWRSTVKTGPYTKIKVTTGTSFINTGLTPGKQYFYKVNCYNLMGGVMHAVSSGYSAIKAGVPLAKPAAPTAKVLSPTSVRLSWSAVTGATGYELWRATSAAGTYARVYRGTARTYTNTALKAGKLYCYKVRAFRKIGTTSYYGPLSAYRAVRPQ